MKCGVLIGLVIAWVVGIYLRGGIYEDRNGCKLNDNWKEKK